ncbi:MAG: PspC domain-containing protein, partial [Dehalococcoidia bacterium]|nr:PspC domain-containing protein [Dehalococcoidia bacterium]
MSREGVMVETRLTRDLDEAMLGGVLAGLSSRYDWDVTLVRIVAVLLTVVTGVVPLVVVYLAAWVIVPPALEIGGGAASDEGGGSAGTPAAGPEAVVDEVTDAVLDAAERVGAAGRIAAEAVRQAAEEISE